MSPLGPIARRGPRHPVRIAHLGLGAFHRAHQAWYTQRANELHPDGSDGRGGWGIAAFTGTRPDTARALAAQDGVYSLVTRGAEGDAVERVESISRAVDGADAWAWRDVLADPALAVVSLTVTEPGYRLGPDRRLRWDEDVAADAEALRRALASDSGEGAMRTAPGRIVDGLISRRAASTRYAGAASLALMSCDNLSGNGAALRSAVLELAHAVDNGVAAWVESEVSFVSTMVDRITPATTDADRDAASALLGERDECPVVTEPFSEWVIAGDFPAGRPAWDEVGVRFVDDVAPYERRKLWLLNAAHSTLAYRGLERGLETVAEAFGDPQCNAAVEALWAEVRPVLGFGDREVDAATSALRERFSNPRIAHRLAQIALDGDAKLDQRQRAIIAAREAAGLGPSPACEATIAAFERYRADVPR